MFRKKVSCTTSLALFWHILEISLLTHEVVDHFMNLVHKKWTALELQHHGGIIARLTCGLGDKLANEYNLLLDDGQLDMLVENWRVTGFADESKPENHLMSFYLLQVTSQASDLHRRIVMPIQRCLI
jgi:hypothetical protein